MFPRSQTTDTGQCKPAVKFASTACLLHGMQYVIWLWVRLWRDSRLFLSSLGPYRTWNILRSLREMQLRHKTGNLASWDSASIKVNEPSIFVDPTKMCVWGSNEQYWPHTRESARTTTLWPHGKCSHVRCSNALDVIGQYELFSWGDPQR